MVHASRVKVTRHIVRLEADALIIGVRHLLRSSAAVGSRLVALVDNLPVVLAAGKGRASSASLAAPLRELAAYLLATSCRMCVRWVPSEANPADAPSRGVHGFFASRQERTDWKNEQPSGQTEDEGPTGHGEEFFPRFGPLGAPSAAEVVEGKNVLQGDTLHDRVLGGCGGPGVPAGALQVVGQSVPSVGAKRAGHVAQQGDDGLGPGAVHGGFVSERRKRTREQCDARQPTPPTSIALFPALFPCREGFVDTSASRTEALDSSGGGVCDLRCAHLEGLVQHDRDGDAELLVLPPPFRGDNLHPQAGSSGLGSSVDPHAGKAQTSLGLGVFEPRLVESEPAHLVAEAWKCERRSADAASTDTGHQRQKEIGKRPVPEEVCESDPSSDGDEGREGRPRGFRFGHRAKLQRRPGASRKDEHYVRASPALLRRSFKVSPWLSPSGVERALLQLQDRFRLETRCASRYGRVVFLELFSGSSRLSRWWRSHGYGVLDFDIKNGETYDVTVPQIEALIKGWIESGGVAGVWAGPPCTSWSRARRGPVGSTWGPLRTEGFLRGLSSMEASDRAKVLVGNATADTTLRIVRACRRRGIAVAVENPGSSMMWQLGGFKSLATVGSSQRHLVDMCSFGTAWRKRTLVATWSLESAERVSLCCGRKGFCSFSNRPHQILEGRDKVRKRLWTSIAEPYPPKFCQHFGQMFIDSFEDRRHRRLNHLLIRSCSKVQ